MVTEATDLGTVPGTAVMALGMAPVMDQAQANATQLIIMITCFSPGLVMAMVVETVVMVLEMELVLGQDLETVLEMDLEPATAPTPD